jgi:predicted homoserine dehydrogenase-like protein
MNYETLFKAAQEKTIRAAISGAGEFGTSFIFQSRRVPGLDVPVIVNRTVQRGIDAFVYAGYTPEDVVECETASQVAAALESGKRVVVADPTPVLEQGIDVFVEGTGNPEVGARYGDAAISAGMHLVMVSKEADSIVGPILADKARKAGLVYTPADGDQPSLLIGLITWARVLGLTLLSAGKSSEYDFVYDPETGIVTSLDHACSVPELGEYWDLGDQSVVDLAKIRGRLCATFPQHAVPDLCEMSHVINATGLGFDVPEFHTPICRIGEIADMMVPTSHGGLLGREGVLDVINCLRKPDEVSLAGGVYVVVACEDPKSWEVLRLKGHVVNRARNAAMIYHPAHLLGVESATSVLAAALLGQSTGGENPRLLCDLAGRTTEDLAAGTELRAGGHHHVIPGVEGILVEGKRVEESNPVPYYMADGCRLNRDLPAGTVLACDMVEIDQGSALARLRREQDDLFHPAKTG